MSGSHAVEPDYGTGRKKLSVYTLGIILCIVLTIIPFGAVMHDSFSRMQVISILFISAILQFLVQVICFLRLNTQTEQGKINVMAFFFTGVILAAVVGGSLWIMWSLRYFMMH